MISIPGGHRSRRHLDLCPSIRQIRTRRAQTFPHRPYDLRPRLLQVPSSELQRMRVTVTVTYEPNSENVSRMPVEPTATRLSSELTDAAQRILREDGLTGAFEIRQDADSTVALLPAG